MPQDRKPEDLARRMAEYAAEVKRLAVELKRDLRKKPPAPSLKSRLKAPLAGSGRSRGLGPRNLP